MKKVLLYFGSFNPIHNGHIALAEYAIERELCDEVILIVSPQNPLKSKYELVADMARFEMTEIACATSKFPEQIKTSAIEFTLDRPSYSIDTLRYLTDNFGDNMDISILMGEDLILEIDRWKDYTEILDNYPIFVYPRGDKSAGAILDRVTYLKDAPKLDISSTAIRLELERGGNLDGVVNEGVLKYIKKSGLWTAASLIVMLTAQIESTPEVAELYVERGKRYYQHNEWGRAINDFNRAIKINPDYEEAKQFLAMAQEILIYRYKDIYNP